MSPFRLRRAEGVTQLFLEALIMENNFGALSRACSRRDFLKLSGITAFTVAGATFLTGCGPAAQTAGSSTGSSKSSSSKKATGKLGDGKTLRIGMEAAYAPYNWQESAESDTTIPIENVSGAYADGYDVQIAKRIAKALDMATTQDPRITDVLSTKGSL